MKREVKLYLAQQEVEFKSVPDILYNFKSDDITSPAAVKNTYSKTITIPGTPTNNAIFGGFYSADFEGYDNGNFYGVGFDPRKRMPFAITVNGEVYETGYARLDKVTGNKNYFEYSISLFGGLGDFFYELEYGDDAGKRKLSSLIYKDPSGNTIDLDFTINVDTVVSGWSWFSQEQYRQGQPWSVINFAPCYDGLPSNFSADKVLVNYNSVTSDVTKLGYSAVTSGGTTYQTYNGYYLAELPKDMTQAEMREFRSWMQRPVLRVQRTIEAICDPENNGGYDVELDSEFFNDNNLLYNRAWVTLPLLSEIKRSDFATFDDYNTHTFTKGWQANYNSFQWFDQQFVPSPVFAANAARLQFNLNFIMSAISYDYQNMNDTMYTSANIADTTPKRNFSAYALQILAFAGTTSQSSIIGASEVAWLTTMVGADYLKPEETAYSPLFGADIKYIFGNFQRTGTTSQNLFQFSTGFTLSMDIPAGAKSFAIRVTPVANLAQSGSGQSYGNRRRVVYKSTSLATITGNSAGLNNPQDSSMMVNGDIYSYIAEGSTMGYTGAQISKNMLLDTDYSPCDFLLSYCKLFGLYFVKDPVLKKIQILTRENFFKRDSVTDIADKIDRTSVEVTPLSFDSKWYNWSNEPVESEYESEYENATGRKYGEINVNTEYAFNNDTKEVLDGNIFNSAIQALERSSNFYRIGNDRSKPWMHNSYKYTLFNPNNIESTIEVTVPKSTTISRQYMIEGYSFYDWFDKPVFHNAENSPTDGKNVLLICNKDYARPRYASGYLYTYVTDDVPEMGVLNSNEACWLYTLGNTGYGGAKIAQRIYGVPHFSRYNVNSGSTYINRSLDFGLPDKLYVPGLACVSAATLYNFFWSNYMEEIFSKNSRIMKCKMLITEKPSVEWLRRFYWFDSTIWRMTAIKDWNIAADKLADVEFVKVQDINKYTSEDPTGAGDIFLTLDSHTVPLTGGTVDFHIVCLTDGLEWTLTLPTGITATQSSGTGDYDGQLQVSSTVAARTLSITANGPVYSDTETIEQAD